MADPGFSPGGGANSQKYIILLIFCQKPHENERIWTPRRNLFTISQSKIHIHIPIHTCLSMIASNEDMKFLINSGRFLFIGKLHYHSGVGILTKTVLLCEYNLLAMIAPSAVQLSTRTLIHNDILFIDT